MKTKKQIYSMRGSVCVSVCVCVVRGPSFLLFYFYVICAAAYVAISRFLFHIYVLVSAYIYLYYYEHFCECAYHSGDTSFFSTPHFFGITSLVCVFVLLCHITSSLSLVGLNIGSMFYGFWGGCVSR